MNTHNLKANWELSQKQIEICKIIFTEGKRINYLAKDKEGRLMGFNKKPLIPRALYHETSSKEDGFKTMETILNSLPKDVRITKPKSEHVIDKEYRGDILCGYKPFPCNLFIFKIEFLVNKTFDLDECLKGIQL